MRLRDTIIINLLLQSCRCVGGFLLVVFHSKVVAERPGEQVKLHTLTKNVHMCTGLLFKAHLLSRLPSNRLHSLRRVTEIHLRSSSTLCSASGT